MLVLSRKLGEEIVIQGNIRITVLSVRGRSVKLGIAAPDDVSIARSEMEFKITNPTPARSDAPGIVAQCVSPTLTTSG